jgi:hypothetical protein
VRIVNGARVAAWAAVTGLLAVSLAGAGASAAQAVSDSFKVVFQANDNVLAGYSSSGSNFTTTAGMMAGTSPSVALLTDGTYEAALEANNAYLALIHLGGGTATTTLGMDPGTSPAIAALPGGGWITAFQDNDNKLYLYDSKLDKTNTGLGMDPGTSPAIAVQPDGSYKVVFQDNDNVLAGYNSSGSSFTTTVGMKPGTSPTLTTEPDGSYEIAAEANTSDLTTIHLGNGYTTNPTTLGMDTGTNPALAIPAPTSTPGSGCGAANNCTPQTFADAILSYPSINGVITASNEYAIETWERAEGGGAGCPGQPANTAPWANSAGPAGNPINTTQQEPGSTTWNSVGVQIYQNYDGVTCWEWGIKANSDTLLNGFYANILSVLDNPVSSDNGQCVDLADAVGDSPWGTGNFSADC